MSSLIDRFGRPARITPTQTLGLPGSIVIGGFVQQDEKNRSIASHDARHKTYSDILANTTVAAAGIRYFLNLVAKAEWSFQPAEADRSGEFAELAEEFLTEDPETPWHRIVRRAAMYRFYGFGIQEWTARLREDGRITFADIAPRAQATIVRWDCEPNGRIIGVIQRSPLSFEEIYLPRGKVMYLVDDSLSTSPEGLGLFRHLVEPAERLREYLRLEGIGFEGDLRGIPIARGPIADLSERQALDKTGEISADNQLKPLRDFLANHVRTAKTGLLLDSKTYQTLDEAGRPSNIRQWDVELLTGDARSFAQNAAAIERTNREIARVLGVEQLLLGEGTAGSFALSRDKTNSFFLIVQSALSEIRDAVEQDLLDIIWALNGLSDDLKPVVETEAIRFSDVLEVTGAMRNLAVSGAPLGLEDPAVGEVYDMMGLTRPPQDEAGAITDATLMRPGDDERLMSEMADVAEGN